MRPLDIANKAPPATGVNANNPNAALDLLLQNLHKNL